MTKSNQPIKRNKENVIFLCPHCGKTTVIEDFEGVYNYIIKNDKPNKRT